MTLPIYPPFSESDFHYAKTDVDIPESIRDKARVIQATIENAHDQHDRHEFRRHPWCRECEFWQVRAEIGDDGLALMPVSRMNSYREFLNRQGITAGVISSAGDFARKCSEEELTLESLRDHVHGVTPKRYDDATLRALLQLVNAANLWQDWDVTENMRAVQRRIEMHLFVHGRPPADNYDPAIDAADDGDGLYLTRDDLDELPEPEWLIPGVLNRFAYVVLRGRDHSYKTFIALSWALSIATGSTWLGRNVSPGRVLYIAGEGAYGIPKRLRAWEYAWYARQRVPNNAIEFRNRAVNLHAGGADLDGLLAHIAEGGYSLVIVDTLNKCSGAADVNGPQANVILHNIERIKRATKDGSVLVIAHTGKADEDVRGWSALEDDADVVWHSKAEGGVISLANTKMKDAAESVPLRLATLPVPEADSLVLCVADEFMATAALTDSQTALMQTLEEAFSESGATKRELSDASGLPRSTFYHALNALKRSGVVVVDGKGDRAIHRLASNAVQLDDALESLTDSNASNAVQSNPTDPAVCLSKSNNPTGLDVGQTALDGTTT